MESEAEDVLRQGEELMRNLQWSRDAGEEEPTTKQTSEEKDLPLHSKANTAALWGKSAVVAGKSCTTAKSAPQPEEWQAKGAAPPSGDSAQESSMLQREKVRPSHKAAWAKASFPVSKANFQH